MYPVHLFWPWAALCPNMSNPAPAAMVQQQGRVDNTAIWMRGRGVLRWASVAGAFSVKLVLVGRRWLGVGA